MKACCVCGREGTRGFKVIPPFVAKLSNGGTQLIPEHVFCVAKQACWARMARTPAAVQIRASMEAGAYD